MHFLMWAAGIAGAALSVGGSVYLVLALLRLRKGLPPQTEPDWTAPAAMLVPCHGAPPRLAECLDTILSQDHPDHSVVFGLHAADDPAKPVIQAAIARALDRNPDLRTKIVVDGRRAGANPKNCNLANMVGHIDEDVLMMIDSDVLVAPDFLRKALSPLRDPAVGGASPASTSAPRRKGFGPRSAPCSTTTGSPPPSWSIWPAASGSWERATERPSP